MRKIILFVVLPFLFSTVAEAQKRKPIPKPIPKTKTVATDYINEWREIDSLTDNGLPKSANEKTLLLYAKAKSENNAPQIIKTLMYRAKFVMQLEEKEGFTASIRLWEEQSRAENFPIKPIMQSLLADMYYKYFARNQWKILQRTIIANDKNADFETWSAQKFIDTSAVLYRVSLSDARLKDIKTETFKDIINQDAEFKLRPTLFDVLAHSALNFFDDDKNYLPHSANGFTLNTKDYFSDANTYSKIALNATDQSEHKLWVLRLYQQLIEFHLNDPEKTALTQIDLDRIQFVHTQSVLESKDSLYQSSLEKLYKNIESDSNSILVANTLAEYHIERGNNYKPNPLNLNRFEKKQAFDILTDALKKFPKTYGAATARQTLKGLTASALNVNTEKVYLPDQTLLAKCNFTNVKKVFFRIIKVTTKFTFDSNDNYPDVLRKSAFLKQWSIIVPEETDLNEHSIEFKIDKLPFGQYFILASTDSNFKKNSNAGKNVSDSKISITTCAARFQVSDISYFIKNEQEQTEFVLMHRQTGAPLLNVAAEFYQNEYRDNKSRNIKIGNRASDANGFILPNIKENVNFNVIFSKGSDTLVGNGNYYRYGNNYNKNVESNSTHFFLDRSLYRPGQTLYYKALLFSHGNNTYMQANPKIIADKNVKITLFDANGQKVSEQTATTNKFGTINGSFVLPTSGLLGDMHLQSTENGYQNFKVEEYKRPKFEVTVETLRSTSILNEKINVQGKAIAYTGANLDGAKVKYRVQRSVELPYEYNWYWGFRRNQPAEIANGEVMTDASGNFQIPFTALPDLQFPKSVKPTFTYTVYADVTDINGETHSAQNLVHIGYTSLMFQETLPASVELKKLDSTNIRVANLNSEAVETSVHYKIELLTPPAKEFINRYWELPDTNLMTELEFKKHFPQYPFKNENEVTQWMVNNIISEGDLNITGKLESSAIDLKKRILQSGTYRFTYSAIDKSGEKITQIQHVTVFETGVNAKTNAVISVETLHPTSLQPNDTLMLNLNTRSNIFHALIQEDYDGKVQSSTWKIIKSSENYTRLIEEKQRGGFSVNIIGVRNNRAYTFNQNVVVPFTNKELQIKYETFRDKLEPGVNEEWRITVAGNKKEHVAAEMVAAMYDASLDAIYKHDWSIFLYNQRSMRPGFQNQQFGLESGQVFYDETNAIDEPTDISRSAPDINNFGLYYQNQPVMYRSMAFPMVAKSMVSGGKADKQKVIRDNEVADSAISSMQINFAPPKVVEHEDISTDPNSTNLTGTNIEPVPIKLRTNLNETVFFYPNLQTDSSGNIVIKFTMGEALTRWKFLAFAHTTELQNVLSEKTIITQKDVMIVPNVPRFLREGDKIVLTAKVNNLSGKVLTATPKLIIKNPLNGEDVSAKFNIQSQTSSIDLNNGASGVAKWNLTVPNNYTLPVALQYSVQSGNFSDGEENVIPVLTNRELITETMPMALRAEQTKTFTFEAIEKAKSSKTLTHQSLTLEFTKNPVWYAVQALPYIMEYPHECAEQIFSRYYANSIASNVVKTMPQISAVFKQWNAYEPDALKSNLNKNPALKSAMLEETPWVINAQNEELQKKNIALLFDLNKMADEQAIALKKLRERQNADGGISWFNGDASNWFITQYILSGMGHLKNLGVTDAAHDAEMKNFRDKGFEFCRAQVEKYYAEIEKNVAKKYTTWEDDHLSASVLQYFYTESFFEKKSQLKPVIADYFSGQMKKYWTKRGIYEQTMMGLIALRYTDNTTAQAILKSLKERAIHNPELGMYWKNQWSYFWYEQPVETQSLLIEFFDAMNQKNDVDEMKIWLIKNKQTTSWRTTKATAEAIYVLLKTGGTSLDIDSKNPTISIGNIPLDLSTTKMETGTGYFKKEITVTNIATQPTQIKVTNPNKNIAWGAMYWQYFENLENIKDFNATPLKLKRSIFKQNITDKGAVLEPIATQNLVAGDKIIVRIELEVDREMEFLHLKDYRASGLEPVNTLSGYKYSGGLGFYETTRDVATDFFFSRVVPGKYVFEYPLVVNLSGTMSNGYAKIQSMYAPEFSAHTDGSSIFVK